MTLDPLVSHVPMKRRNVSNLAQTRYAQPARCNDIHIAMPKGTPLCNVWLTLLRGSDVPAESFGDSDGVISEMLA